MEIYIPYSEDAIRYADRQQAYTNMMVTTYVNECDWICWLLEYRVDDGNFQVYFKCNEVMLTSGTF